MKLAFCLFNYFPYGGLQRDFLRIAQTCRDRGHDVHVYTMRWDGPVEPGLTVHLVAAQGWQNHTRSRSFAEKVRIQLEREHYDVVMGFNKMPYLDIYYAADVCYVTRIQALRNRFYRWLPRYWQWAALEQAVFAPGKSTEIVLISPLQVAEYQQAYQTEAQRLHLLPPGIAKDRIAPANAADIRDRLRQEQSLSDDQFLLLLVGSGFKTKGLDRALHALAALPAALRARCYLYVIGQGNAQPFQAMANQLGIAQQVRFLGARSDVSQWLLAGDGLIHPAYHENTGTVILEAMVAGLPVLTVDVCGYAHYVNKAQAGIVLASPFQQTALNAALEKMVLSTERAQWHQQALAFAADADIYSLPEKAADFIDSIGLRT